MKTKISKITLVAAIASGGFLSTKQAFISCDYLFALTAIIIVVCAMAACGVIET